MSHFVIQLIITFLKKGGIMLTSLEICAGAGGQALGFAMAGSTYSMYFRDDLMLGSGVPAYNLNGFFTSYNNIGIVIREDLSDAQLETLLACINSIDVSGFNNKYNN